MLKRQTRYAYSPITRRPDYVWPNGARLAVYCALGIEDYAFGEGMSENLLAGASQPDYVNASWRDYGNRIGGFRLIDAFAAREIPFCVLLNTAVYDHAPELVDHARAAGCEIVAHGIANSDTLAGRSPPDELAYVKAVAAAIAAKEGAPPKGWSSPWLAHTDRTPEALKQAGYGYVLDLGMDEQPVWLRTDEGPLLCVPYALELNDSSAVIGRLTGAQEFERMIVDQFEALLEASRERPLVLSLVTHSFISGQPFRLRALGRALDRIAARRQDVWLTTPGRIAQFIAERPHLAV